MPTKSPRDQPSDHVVSRGYQRNFSDDTHRIALLDSATGQPVDLSRAIKSNFAIPGFNEITLEDGPSDVLEREFTKIEARVLHQARTVDPGNAGPKMRDAMARLFALHLVRSEPFRTMHGDIVDQLRTKELSSIAASGETLAIFQRQYGKLPADGEIEAIGERLIAKAVAGRRLLASSTLVQYDRIVQVLGAFHLQVLWIRDSLPGFIFGDIPFVHANLDSSRYGFRDVLAIGDADLIVGPLTRRVAVCFTVRQTPNTELTTRKNVELVNAVFCRAALKYVACHPGDTLATQQLIRRIDRRPARDLRRG